MPRLKKTDAQRRAERFDKHYRAGKAKLRLNEPEIAAALGMGESTLRKHKREPDTFSLGQIVRLCRVFEWSDEEFLDIIRTKK